LPKLPDGTYVGADVINRYLGGNATESDVKQIKQLGSSINEENMNSVLKRMDDIANVKMGKDTYGEMNKKTAGMNAYDKISYFSDVMSSPEFKAHTEELIKTAREQKAKAEGKKGDTADVSNIKQNEETGILNNAKNSIQEGNTAEVNNTDNTQNKTVSNINENINKEDVFDNVTLSSSQNNSIDTDNALSKNNQVDNGVVDKVETVNQAINAESKTDGRIINQEGQNDIVNGENDIVNSDKMGYKGEEGIINSDNIPALNKRTDYYKYVREIANKTDISLNEKVSRIQETFKLLKNKKDVICPSDSKFVDGFDKKGHVVYKWASKLGFVPESIKAITRENSLPTIWHRFGSLSGSNFTKMQEGMEQYSTSELGLPYIENKHARHNGTFNTDDYFNIIDAIRNGDIKAFNAIRQKQGLDLFDSKKLNYYQKKYNDYIKKVKVEIGEINAPYGLYGYVNPLEINSKIELKGGAEQYTTPFTAKLLEKLGLLNITK